jgi:acetyltransferase
VIAVPCDAVPRVLGEAAKVGARAALLLTAAPAGNAAVALRWSRDVASLASKHGIRLVGPGAFGVIRTGIGLNATFSDARVLPGRLALVAQSGAVCTAMLDFALPLGLGFSTVISLGGVLDVDVGELLDALITDVETDGILLYLEQVHEARRFLSALRAAARAKPVVLLKAGRAMEPGDVRPSPDAVFDAAVRRSGTVRVRTYTQLFAVARLLASGRFPHGDRIAIVANGRGPGMLAADSAHDAGHRARALRAGRRSTRSTRSCPRRARARIRSTCAATRPPNGSPTPCASRSPMHPSTRSSRCTCRGRSTRRSTRRARSPSVARASTKPVLGAWLGAIERPEAREALEAGGIVNFYTPENAVEAFAFLASYRRHQELLLEVPPSQPEPDPPDYPEVERIPCRDRRAPHARGRRARRAAARVPPAAAGARARAFARRREGDRAAARLPGRAGLRRAGVERAGARVIADGRALDRAWKAAVASGRASAKTAPRVHVRKALRVDRARELLVAIATDETFGPVIALGPGARTPLPDARPALALPPLNRRLALDLVAGGRRGAEVSVAAHDDVEALVRMLLQLSSLVCLCPWVQALELDTLLGAPGAVVVGAHIAVDARRRERRGYGHMAIHPYPTELAGTMVSRDGATLAVRPIRPEDAALERRFVNGLSEESRYFRFFYRLHELTPQMLARFTQVDYDREMALVAIAPDGSVPEGERFVGVARYIANPDGESAEFAIVLADDWQGRGVGRGLMERLAASARRRGFSRLSGTVLRANHAMLRFVERFGFTVADDPHDDDQVIVTLAL